MLRGTHEKQECCYDFAQEFAIFVRTLDHCNGDLVDERTDYVNVTTSLMHEMSKKEENESQGDDDVMVLHQGK